MPYARVFIAAAAGVLFWQLVVPPVVGVGNNGDFSRTYGIFHLTMPVADEVRYADTKYQFDPRVNYFGGFYSSEILLVPPALVLNAIFSKDGSFDVRWMGFIQGMLFLTAFYLFLPLSGDAPRGLRWLLSGLALVMFGDVMYVAYLNSFYTDVAAYLFLLLSVVLALRVLRWNRRSDAILLAAAGMFLVTSKAQHAVLGLWMAALFCVLSYRKGARWLRAGAAILAIAALMWLWKSTPEEYAARGCFSTIFHYLLPHSANVDRTLADLGLDATYRPYIGMVSFSEGSPMNDPGFVAAFRRRITYGGLTRFLLTHPRDTYVALRVSLDEAGRQRPALGKLRSLRRCGAVYRKPGVRSVEQSQTYTFRTARLALSHLLCGSVRGCSAVAPVGAQQFAGGRGCRRVHPDRHGIHRAGGSVTCRRHGCAAASPGILCALRYGTAGRRMAGGTRRARLSPWPLEVVEFVRANPGGARTPVCRGDTLVAERDLRKLPGGRSAAAARRSACATKAYGQVDNWGVKLLDVVKGQQFSGQAAGLSRPRYRVTSEP